jgi:hypothetical protein
MVSDGNAALSLNSFNRSDSDSLAGHMHLNPTANSDVTLVAGGGFVGIGVLRPQRRLHVGGGDTLIDGDLINTGMGRFASLTVEHNMTVTKSIIADSILVRNLHIESYTNLAQKLSVLAVEVKGPMVVTGNSTLGGNLVLLGNNSATLPTVLSQNITVGLLDADTSTLRFASIARLQSRNIRYAHRCACETH